MRQGMKDKVVLPKPLAEKLLPQFQTHIVEKPEESLFWGQLLSYLSLSATNKKHINKRVHGDDQRAFSACV